MHKNATHRDLLNGAAGVIEPKEVVGDRFSTFSLKDEPYINGYVFATTAKDGMRFVFDISEHYDATKITMRIYRVYDTPKEMII